MLHVWDVIIEFLISDKILIVLSQIWRNDLTSQFITLIALNELMFFPGNFKLFLMFIGFFKLYFHHRSNTFHQTIVFQIEKKFVFNANNLFISYN